MTAGVAAISKQKVESFVHDFVENSEMTEEEGKKFLEELTAKSKEYKADFEEKVEEIAHKIVEKMHIATTEQLDNLEKRIAELEAEKAKSA